MNETNLQDELIATNCVFFQKQKDGKITYYIPGYLRLKVKNFTAMDLENLDAQMNAAIIFTIYYGDIPENIAEKLQTQLILNFGRDDALKLTQQEGALQTKIARKKGAKQIQFTVRKLFHLRIDSEVFWSPFQIINLILSITVQPITIQNSVIKVNLMDHPQKFLKLSYTDQGTFGNYDLAEALMQTKYSNNRVYKINRKPSEQNKLNPFLEFESKIQHFQYAHFTIPLYKYPIVAVATIFLPLWLLALVNLGIFFQSNLLANRIQSIASLMIAFVALIPVIREQIPPNPKIVFVEILVYIQTLTSLFAFIHSMVVQNDTNFDLVWYNDGLFMASFIITIVTMIIVFVMMLIHYFVWVPKYNGESNKNVEFVRSLWKNQQCDTYFKKASLKKFFKIINDTQDILFKKSSSKEN